MYVQTCSKADDSHQFRKLAVASLLLQTLAESEYTTPQTFTFLCPTLGFSAGTRSAWAKQTPADAALSRKVRTAFFCSRCMSANLHRATAPLPPCGANQVLGLHARPYTPFSVACSRGRRRMDRKAFSKLVPTHQQRKHLPISNIRLVGLTRPF